MSEWTTVDFRPASPVVTGPDDKPKLLRWQCLYLTGMTNTPYMALPMAGWVTQRNADGEVRVVAAVCVSNGTVHVWDEVRTSNNVHASRVPWQVIEPLPRKEWPSKHSARQRWQEIQGSIIIENSQDSEE